MKEKKWWKRLQPLRIPPGWYFLFNKLEQIEPERLDKNDRVWLFHFVEDILYMERKNQRKINKKVEEQVIGIDLGWYPDGEPQGAYTLLAILDHNWEEPLLQYRSRCTQEVVDQLEEWLFRYFSDGFLDEKLFRKNHPNLR